MLGYSSQWSSSSWSASQALGAPDTDSYGDIPTAWAPLPINGTLEFLTVGFATPVHATGVTIRETYGNGFVYQVDLQDMDGVLHTIWSGEDPSQPGNPVDFAIDFAATSYLVNGVKIYTNTDHDPNAWEEIDAVQLRGNLPPLAVNDGPYTIAPGEVLSVDALANDSDPDGDLLTASVVALPAHGALYFNSDGTFDYEPTPGYTGSDSFTYKVTDGLADSNIATVSISIQASTLPNGQDDDYSITHDQLLLVLAADLLSNDSEPSGNPLQISQFGQPNNGTVTQDGDGNFLYTPESGFVGADSFIYQVSNGTDVSDWITVHINVNNSLPAVDGQYYEIAVDAVLTVNEPLIPSTDEDGDPLSLDLVEAPVSGSLTWYSDGSFQYTPQQGFTGLDSFAFSYSDGLTVGGVIVQVQVGQAQPVYQPQMQFTAQVWGLMQARGVQHFTLNDIHNMMLAGPVGSANELTGANAAVAAAMKVYFEQLKNLGGTDTGLGPYRLDVRDLRALDSFWMQYTNLPPGQRPSQQQQFAVDVASTFQNYVNVLPTISVQLFVGAPDPAAVRQGATGDCSFLSAVIALLSNQLRFGVNYQGPTIQSMIQELLNDTNGNGQIDRGESTYQVLFPGQTNAITVQAPTYAEMVLYANAGANGLWITILEKAYCQLRQNSFATFRSYFRTNVAQDNLQNGEQLRLAINELTRNRVRYFALGNQPRQDGFVQQLLNGIRGDDPNRITFQPNQDAIVRQIRFAIDQGRLVTTQTAGHNQVVQIPFDPMGQTATLWGTHAYAIINYQVIGGQVQFLLRNPWNTGDAFGSTFWVDQTFLFRYFPVFAIQTWQVR